MRRRQQSNKQNVLRLRANAQTVRSGSRSSGGRLFQIVGPQTAKARGPNEIVLVRGMNSSRFDADRSSLRPGPSDCY